MPTGEGTCPCGGMLRPVIGCITRRWLYCPDCHVTLNTATRVLYDLQGREVRWSETA